MKNKLLLFIFFIFYVLFNSKIVTAPGKSVKAAYIPPSKVIEVTKVVEPTVVLVEKLIITPVAKKQGDTRATNIGAYLKKSKSPLATKVSVIVKEADKYGIDPYLIAAIAMKESSGGRILCGKFNPFGIMEFSTGKRKCRNFKSWDEVIIYEAWLLGEYKKAGRASIDDIGRRYNPDTTKEWVAGVTKIMNLMKE